MTGSALDAEVMPKQRKREVVDPDIIDEEAPLQPARARRAPRRRQQPRVGPASPVAKAWGPNLLFLPEVPRYRFFGRDVHICRSPILMASDIPP